jgi:hypothetical protein
VRVTFHQKETKKKIEENFTESNEEIYPGETGKN